MSDSPPEDTTCKAASADEITILPMDLDAWRLRYPKQTGGELSKPSNGSPNGSPNGLPGLPPASVGGRQTDKYGASILASEAEIVARAAPGDRNNTFNTSVYKVYGYVGDNTIDDNEARQSLMSAAAQCGLPDDEARKTFDSARAKGLANPRSTAHVGNGQTNGHANGSNGSNGSGHTLALSSAAPAPATRPPTKGEKLATCLPGFEENPDRLAGLFIDKRVHADGLRLRFWREEFHFWDGLAYRPVPAKEIKAQLARAIGVEFQQIHKAAMQAFGMKKESADAKPSAPPKILAVSSRLVTDVHLVLTGMTLMQAHETPEQPAWLPTKEGKPASDWLPTDVLPAANFLVHLPSVAAGLPATRPPTPLFFSAYSLGYSFAPLAGPPVEWLAFLHQLWGEDLESIETLQEWMGYLLTADTSLQKIMMLIGPKRSGKGTIARVIQAMIGNENVVNPTLSGLTDRFGLEPLLNKTAAIITDARISGRTDTSIAIERLLSISGEDSQTVGRKHVSSLTTKLSTRFTLISNELPRMQDSSGALVGRMIFLKLTQTFFGKEDRSLFVRKLAPELPSILNWAIEGWVRLRDRGYIRQPESGRDEAEAMDDLSSPVKSFIKDCCVVGKGFEAPRSDMFVSWKSWCEKEGIDSPGNEEMFGRNLRAAEAGIGTKRLRPGDGTRPRAYTGIRLLEVGEDVQSRLGLSDDDSTPPFVPPPTHHAVEPDDMDDPMSRDEYWDR